MIEIKIDFITHIDTYEAARLKIKDGYNNLSNVVNNGGEVEIDSQNGGLIEFGI